MPIFPKLVVQPPKLANHNLSHYFKTSMCPGAEYPILVRPVLAGEMVDMDISALINTQALLTPLYGTYDLNIDVYAAGISLYIPKLWRNGSMSDAAGNDDVSFPTITFTGYDFADTANQHAFGSSIWSYLGYGGGDSLPNNLSAVGATQALQSINNNAIPFLMYLDIIRNYYVNRQEVNCYYISANSFDANEPSYGSIDLKSLDSFFQSLPANGGALNTLIASVFGTSMNPLFGSANFPSVSGFGLFLRTFKPDMMNVILNGSRFDANVNTVKVTVDSNTFGLDQLAIAKKLWLSRNKDSMTSGTFRDWVRVHFGVTPRIEDDRPTFLGSFSQPLMFEEIRATADSESSDGTSTNLGDKASTGQGFLNNKRIRFRADRPMFLMVLASITPRVDYGTSQKRWTNYSKLSDMFRPEYNGIGLQDVLASDLTTAYPGGDNGYTLETIGSWAQPNALSLGKQPAWMEYMSAVNEVRGTFLTSESSWVLLRDFTADATQSPGPTTGLAGLINPSAYVFPHLWNQPFAIQSPDAQNFLCQFHFRDISRSPVLKRLLPWF